MLSIGKIALGQHRYYEQQVAGGGDDYYSGRGEAPGEWVGAGAQALGLSGRVSAEQFNALIAGLDPRDPSVRLRASERDPKVAALDLTFSAPKSVSVLFAVAPEEVSGELVACHEEAVRAALGYLEDTAVMVRRGDGGERVERAEGLIAAAYRHRMSRALDPAAAHARRRREPGARAGRPLHGASRRAAVSGGEDRRLPLPGAPARAGQRAPRAGVGGGPQGRGRARRACERPVLEHFSKRRARDAARGARRAGSGLGSKAAAESAALATRDRKQYGDRHPHLARGGPGARRRARARRRASSPSCSGRAGSALSPSARARGARRTSEPRRPPG